jgi:hypothetical protein
MYARNLLLQLCQCTMEYTTIAIVDLSIGILQGDTFAPYLFAIVLDYDMRDALQDQTLGLKIANQV